MKWPQLMLSQQQKFPCGNETVDFESREVDPRGETRAVKADLVNSGVLHFILKNRHRLTNGVEESQDDVGSMGERISYPGGRVEWIRKVLIESRLQHSRRRGGFHPIQDL